MKWLIAFQGLLIIVRNILLAFSYFLSQINRVFPYYLASATFLQKIFQSSLNKTRKTQIDTSETEELTFTTGTKKSLNSFKEIGTMILDEHMDRSDKMFDSWGDFGNAISFGIPKGIYQGLENNYNEMVDNPSLRTVSNWITLGGVDMTIGAVNPDDPLSAEHWLNSMGLAGTVVGGGALSQSIKSATTTTTIKPATKVPTSTKPNGNQSAQPNITNSSIDNKTVTQPKAADGNKTGSQVSGDTVKGTESGRPVQQINNRFPDDVQTGKEFSFNIENGYLKNTNGLTEVDFVVDMNGKLHIGRGHSFLANGESLQSAGKLKINGQGQVRSMSNLSGHYTPSIEQARLFPQILEQSGIRTKNAWHEIYAIETTTSGYVNINQLVKISSSKIK
ncbi:hypothetical protein [Bacillus alkalicellulosilyticus]|uniref:hypothetical protein n=1 Tax=Alkalihalobacterium alkalicellulosilyticum TaxID=1912214 RepID=UPI000998E128|nr:hypothetical protein [Bacillus alkalicellulosilyticus]